jgi:hypothetical protein
VFAVMAGEAIEMTEMKRTEMKRTEMKRTETLNWNTAKNMAMNLKSQTPPSKPWLDKAKRQATLALLRVPHL